MSTQTPLTVLRKEDLLAEIKAEFERRLQLIADLTDKLIEARENLERFRREINGAINQPATLEGTDRRTRVADLLRQGLTVSAVATQLGITAATVRNDIGGLTRAGKWPLKGDDAQTIQRNHIIRLWKHDGRVQSEADVAKILGIPVETALCEVAWLEQHGHIEVDHSGEEKPRPEPPTVQSPFPPPVQLPPPVVAPKSATPAPAFPPAEKIPDPVVRLKPEVAAALAKKSSEQAEEPKQEAPKLFVDAADDLEKAASKTQLFNEIRRQQGHVKSMPAQLYTTTVKFHSHVAKVDHFGDGQTIVDGTGHVHRVTKLLVSTAQGHTHDLTIAKPRV